MPSRPRSAGTSGMSSAGVARCSATPVRRAAGLRPLTALGACRPGRTASSCAPAPASPAMPRISPSCTSRSTPRSRVPAQRRAPRGRRRDRARRDRARGSRSRRRRRPSGRPARRASISPTGSVATTRPPRSTVTRSAISKISSSRCDTYRTLVPARAPREPSRTAARPRRAAAPRSARRARARRRRRCQPCRARGDGDHRALAPAWPRPAAGGCRARRRSARRSRRRRRSCSRQRIAAAGAAGEAAAQREVVHGVELEDEAEVLVDEVQALAAPRGPRANGVAAELGDGAGDPGAW